MLKPERMSKLFVVGPKSTLPKVVSKLHSLKVAHIIEHKKDDYDLCAPLEQFEKTSSLLVQIRSLATHLNISTDDAKFKNFNLEELEKDIAAVKTATAKIIEDIPEEETLTLYKQGDFTDLCRGPHVPSTGRLKAFKLTKVSGAYWRGDSSNEMLQRIYGTAWPDKKALKDYLYKLEEAEKRLEVPYQDIETKINKLMRKENTPHNSSQLGKLRNERDEHLYELAVSKAGQGKLEESLEMAEGMDSEKVYELAMDATRSRNHIRASATFALSANIYQTENKNDEAARAFSQAVRHTQLESYSTGLYTSDSKELYKNSLEYIKKGKELTENEGLLKHFNDVEKSINKILKV